MSISLIYTSIIAHITPKVNNTYAFSTKKQTTNS